MQKKERKNLKQKRVVVGLLLLLGAAIIIGGWLIYKNINKQKKEDDLYKQIARTALVFENMQEYAATNNPPTAVDFQMLKEINPNTVAWVWSANGKISYPVVQGNDNDYYLDHLIDGTPDENGTIFVDYRNAVELSDRNTFIYGNQTNSDAMLSSLKEYAKDDYHQQYPTLLMITETGSYTLEVFSGYEITAETDPYRLTYEDDEAFLDYIGKVKEMSDFTNDISPSEKDRLVSLSAATASAEEGYMLHCKIVGK